MFWDLGTGKEMQRVALPLTTAWHTRLTADGKLLAAAAAGKRIIDLYPLPQGKPATRITASGMVTALAISQETGVLTVGCLDGTVELHPVKGGKALSLGKLGGQVSGLAFAADGKTLAGSDRKGRVVLWVFGPKK